MATRSERSGNGERAEPISTGVDGTMNEPEERVEAVAADLGADLEELEERLREAADRLTDTAKALGSIASRQVQAHPLAAFGVAFLAGVTIAKLMRH